MRGPGCAVRRLAGEHGKLRRDDHLEGVTAAPRDGDFFLWDATVVGPAETPWSGASLKLEMVFPPEYPFKPPAVRFVTPISHPNVYPDGSVCVDLLGAQWAPACDVRSVLMTLQLLLAQPNPDSPANTLAADAFRARGMLGLEPLNRNNSSSTFSSNPSDHRTFAPNAD